MDVGRLSRAAEALDYERAWQAFRGGDMDGLAKVHELKMVMKRLNP